MGNWICFAISSFVRIEEMPLGKSSNRQIFDLRRYLEFQISNKTLFEPLIMFHAFQNYLENVVNLYVKNVGSPPLCHISPKQVCIG